MNDLQKIVLDAEKEGFLLMNVSFNQFGSKYDLNKDGITIKRKLNKFLDAGYQEFRPTLVKEGVPTKEKLENIFSPVKNEFLNYTISPGGMLVLTPELVKLSFTNTNELMNTIENRLRSYDFNLMIKEKLAEYHSGIFGASKENYLKVVKIFENNNWKTREERILIATSKG